ncbi:MAG: 2-C-methyl-D-erythritol 2,4-cyclodiphosphate synthase [Gemmatimonadetes bacterium]|nr:2-C-methyl-D-erythritol 2,4-cyclodiphosphate synthase [Gemmatimonadota bacterium]
MRIGFGFDSHRFDPSRPCILGGVTIPDTPGLAAFSDGDALAHAVTDAVLGAAGLGDIGRHFPPGDERWRGADSMGLLRTAVGMARDAGYGIGNVDVTLVCERPRIDVVADRIRSSLAGALQVTPQQVSVKGKTSEGMGWEGRGEGIAVHAVILLVPASPRGPS